MYLEAAADTGLAGIGGAALGASGGDERATAARSATAVGSAAAGGCCAGPASSASTNRARLISRLASSGLVPAFCPFPGFGEGARDVADEDEEESELEESELEESESELEELALFFPFLPIVESRPKTKKKIELMMRAATALVWLLTTLLAGAAGLRGPSASVRPPSALVARACACDGSWHGTVGTWRLPKRQANPGVSLAHRTSPVLLHMHADGASDDEGGLPWSQRLTRTNALRLVAAASMAVEDVAQAGARAKAEPLQKKGLKKGGGTNLVQVTDPATFSALAYAPTRPADAHGALPLIVVLHGAGKNQLDAWSLADPRGEHAGLAPSLLATGQAPAELANNFAVVAPYSAGKRSFYEEPRSKLLRFVDWVCSDAGRAAGCPPVDPSRIFLFGFSDGATVGVELLTSGRFKGGVFAAYGFTGELPALAVKRLADVPIWIFHSADDVIFPVRLCRSSLPVDSVEGSASVSAISSVLARMCVCLVGHL